MLIRRALLPLVVAAIALFAVPSAAFAGGTGGVQCGTKDPSPVCNVDAGTPRDPGDHGGGGQGGGGDGKCRDPQHHVIPCERDGGIAGPDGCYYTPTDPSPSTIAALGGQPQGPGGWYLRVCYGADGTATTGLGGAIWVAGNPPVVSPAVLARQARSKLHLPTVRIGMNPPGDQLVNLPVWLALDRSSWKTQSATAAVPGVSVTATARPVRVTWSMGDGSTRVCDGPGTAWSPGTNPAKASPDCGFVYRRSSANAPGGTYRVVVTVTWTVTWAGAGQTGTVPGLETTGQLLTRVQESQAVVS
jgi:hypothetical protein